MKTEKNSKYAVAPVIVTASGKVVAGKARIEKFHRKNPKAKVVVELMEDWARLPFLKVARDRKGRLHLTTRREAKAKGWEVSA